MKIGMKRSLRHTGYLWMLLAMPLAASTVHVYVANHGGTTIHVIDAATDKVVDVIENIEVPEAVRFSPDGSRLYISNGAENVVIVLDRATKRLIGKVPLSGHANDLAITPDGRRVLVCIRDDNPGLDIIDTASLERIKTLPSKDRLHDIEVSADGKYAIAGSPEGKFATIYDLQREEIAWELPLDQGVQPLTIENGPDGSPRRLFLNLYDLHGFAVIDFEKRQEVARITLPDEPGGFVGSRGPSHGIRVAPDGKTVWVNSNPTNSVYVYSLPDLKLLGRVPLPDLRVPGKPPLSAIPEWLAFTPDSKKVYVSHNALRSVSVIDAEAMKVVTVVPVGEMPDRMNTLELP